MSTRRFVTNNNLCGTRKWQLELSRNCSVNSGNTTIFVVGNTLMKSFFQRPLDLGADIVMYLLMKQATWKHDFIRVWKVAKSTERAFESLHQIKLWFLTILLRKFMVHEQKIELSLVANRNLVVKSTLRLECICSAHQFQRYWCFRRAFNFELQ